MTPAAHEPPPFDLTQAREVFRMSAQLHGTATRRAIDRLTEADFEQLERHHAEYTAALADGRVEDAILADDRFHHVVLEAAGDPDLIVSVELMLPRLRRIDLWLFTRKAFGPDESSHPDIIKALRAKDVELATRLVEDTYLQAGEDLAAIVARTSP